MNRLISYWISTKILLLLLPTLTVSNCKAKALLANDISGDTISVASFGAKGDGITDDSDAFQRAMNTRKVVVIPATSKFYNIGKTVRVYNSVLGINKPVLRANPYNLKYAPKTSKEWGKLMIFHIGNRIGEAPMEISNIVFEGNYNNGKIPNEHNHLINISSSENITIKNNVMKNAAGDAISVTFFNFGYEPYLRSYSSDINIINNAIENPYRCGVAVISGRKISIENNKIFKSNNYVNPIDLETENWEKTIMYGENISIKKNYIYAPNTDIAVNVIGSKDYATQNLKIESNDIFAGETAIRLASTNGIIAKVNIENNRYYAPVFLSFKPGNKHFHNITITKNKQQIDNSFFGNISKVDQLYITGNENTNKSNNLIITNSDNVFIENNKFKSSESNSILITSSKSVENYKIKNNVISSAKEAVSLGYPKGNAFGVKNLSIEKNQISSKSKSAVVNHIKAKTIVLDNIMQ